jgi:hypothetical protein
MIYLGNKMEKNFSLTNSDIKKYFEGDDSYAPIRELIYLHTHPLIRPNFLIEINNLAVEAGNKLIARNVPNTSSTIATLEKLCIKLGQNLPESTEAAEIALPYLRELYILCNKINRG